MQAGNLVLEIALVIFTRMLFTATPFVLLQLVTPRRFFFAVVKEPVRGAPAPAQVDEMFADAAGPFRAAT